VAVPSSTFQVDDPGAGTGTTSVPSNNNICPRSGFRQSVHRPLVQDGYGELVRLDSLDGRHPSDNLTAVSNTRQHGPENPEQENDFYAEIPADVIIEDDKNTQHRLAQTVNMTDNVYGSIFLKRREMTYAGITLTDDRGFFYSYALNMLTGAFDHESNDGRLTTISSEFTEEDEDYFRIIIAADFAGSATITFTINMLGNDADPATNHRTVGNKNNYLYQGTDLNLIAWGAQLSATNIAYTTGAANLLPNSEAMELWTPFGSRVKANSASRPLFAGELKTVTVDDL